MSALIRLDALSLTFCVHSPMYAGGRWLGELARAGIGGGALGRRACCPANIEPSDHIKLPSGERYSWI